jgi:hypothetical protein
MAGSAGQAGVDHLVRMEMARSGEWGWCRVTQRSRRALAVTGAPVVTRAAR